MIWTDPCCFDLDERAAADPGFKRLAAYGELKQLRMERTAARMRAANIGNHRKRLASQAWRRRLKEQQP
jgi:hypothetical protein